MNRFVVFAVEERTWNIGIHEVKAKNGMHAFLVHAERNSDRPHEYLASLPKKEWDYFKEKFEFPGESMVCTETILEQKEVFQ